MSIEELMKINVFDFLYRLEQASQTDGPRATCGPIVCLMRPTVTDLKKAIT